MSLSISNKEQFILGNFKIGKTLGQGTFGKVKLGIHVTTQQKVAVKILEKQKIVQHADMERVTREICILKRLRHPNIIQLYQIIETKKDIYLIMEYAEGGQLFDYIVKRKRVEQKEAVNFMHQIFAGVQYIHRNGVVHRDLKPENLLLDHNKNIKIVDFGLSNQYKQGEKLKTACGSPCYAAPQMIAGKNYQCINVDIWSCGVIMYALLCGYLPFQDPNTNKLYKKILSGEFQIPKFITSDAKDLMKKILNVDPEARYKIQQIRESKWYRLVPESAQLSKGILVGKDEITIDDRVFKELQKYKIDLNQAKNYLINNRHNQVTSLYYLILQKYKRQGFPKRTQSPLLYRPGQKDDKGNNTSNHQSNITDIYHLLAKKKKVETIQSTKNDSMNASNIISSLVQANKNNNKLIANFKNKKATDGDVNFDKVQENKQFPQKQVSKTKTTSNNNSSVANNYTQRNDYPGRSSIDQNVLNISERKNQPQPRISLNQYANINKGYFPTTKRSQQTNVGSNNKRNELSDQLKQISMKIDKQIQELKKQNNNYMNSQQYTDRKDPNNNQISLSINSNNGSSLTSRKRVSNDLNSSLSGTRQNSERDKSKIYGMDNLNIHNGPFNPRAIFELSPRIIYQKILGYLQLNKISFMECDKLTIEIQKRIRISLQNLHGLPSVYIICFSERNSICQKLLSFLEI